MADPDAENAEVERRIEQWIEEQLAKAPELPDEVLEDLADRLGIPWQSSAAEQHAKGSAWVSEQEAWLERWRARIPGRDEKQVEELERIVQADDRD